MRKELFRMPREAAIALLARAPAVHLATTDEEGRPILRALHAAVLDLGAGPVVAFHGAPVGEKTEGVGRPAVVSAEEVVASIPSYFIDAERACPATSLYRSVQVHGVLERVHDPASKVRVLEALLAKHQPEGGFVPITADGPLYAKAVASLLVLAVSLADLDGKAKLGQNRTPPERTRMVEALWRRGAPGDAVAIQAILDANDDLPTPTFLRAPVRVDLAPGGADADACADLLEGTYWHETSRRADIIASHLGSSAWIVGRDSDGRVVGSARVVSDGAKIAWLSDVIVAGAHCRRGVGASLVRILLDHPAVRGVRSVRLGTRDAEGFYERFGFVRREPVTIQMVRAT